MALPSSGTLALSAIQTEFGGSNPISLSEYYRNGGLVTGNNTNVPTSGVIKVSDFYGAQKLPAIDQQIYYATATIDIAMYLNFSVTSSSMYPSGPWSYSLNSYSYSGNSWFSYLSQYSSVEIYIISWTGRGAGWSVTQQPTAGNGWVGQVFMADDPPSGSSGYTVTIGMRCTP